MKENSFLAPDVNPEELAARTKNYSGAALEGLVKSAVSFALNHRLSMDDLTKPVDEESIKLQWMTSLHAFQEIVPAFGASTDDLSRYRVNGMVDCGKRHNHIYQRAMLLVEQVKVSRGSPLVTCLLLLVLLKRLPPKGKSILVIGTTSEVDVLESLGICDAFSVSYRVPRLKKEDTMRVLKQLNVFADEDIAIATEALEDISLLLILFMCYPDECLIPKLLEPYQTGWLNWVELVYDPPVLRPRQLRNPKLD